MPNSAQYTVEDVAQWMAEQVREHDELLQSDVITAIEDRFGCQFMYENANGNSAIDPTVLIEFKRLTEEDVVWERGERLWRLRNKLDEPGRQQG
jgi:hypothetical protein